MNTIGKISNAWGGNTQKLGAWMDLLIQFVLTGEPVPTTISSLVQRWGVSQGTAKALVNEMIDMGVLDVVEEDKRGVRFVNVQTPHEMPFARIVFLGEAPPEAPERKPRGRRRIEYTPLFLEAFKLHPRGSKQRAFSYWQVQIAEKGKTEEELLTAVKALAEWYKRQGTEQRYQKHLATFLSPNEDYVDEQEKAPPPEDDGTEALQEGLV